VRLADHAASAARDHRQAADPGRWTRPQTPDSDTDAQSRPITAVLMDEF
jgi:hypothetical protein